MDSYSGLGSSPPGAWVVYDLHETFDNLKGDFPPACRRSVVSIIGALGSGKSLYIRCINLLEIPGSGEKPAIEEKIRFKERSGTRVAAEDKLGSYTPPPSP